MCEPGDGGVRSGNAGIMMEGARPRLRVCIDARLHSEESGNDFAVIGLASGLSQLLDGNEDYLFLMSDTGRKWLASYMKGPCHELNTKIDPPPRPLWKRAAGSIPGARNAWHKLTRPAVNETPVSDGRIEREQVEVMHFTRQDAFVTSVPSLYQPYDLQHRHFPDFFTKEERQWRDRFYQLFCQQARVVLAHSRWGKQDLVKNLGLPEGKIAVVPLAPVLTAYPTPVEADKGATREKFRLPDHFIFYPGQTWPHKNHIGLLRGLALLRDRGVRVPLVCSGHKNDFFLQIEAEIQRLNLTEQVQFVGFVSALELQCLYRLCRCMVFPTKFEGWGLPLLEAALVGAPVACSRVRPVCDVVGDAALLFDPDQPDEIAGTIRRLWTEPEVRQEFVERARRRAGLFTWNKTARLYRALYRKIADRELTKEDHELLEEPPLV
jgi:glycosyltransferase involved in cell wall biosynthesis